MSSPTYPSNIWLDANHKIIKNPENTTTLKEYININIHHTECDRLMLMYKETSNKLKEVEVELFKYQQKNSSHE